MKKIITFLTMLLFMTSWNIFAQVYQLPNGGFEEWDGTGSAEPTGWNSFATAECTLTFGCGTAQQTHHENSSDARPGSAGTHSCRVYATSVLGVVANGNMTTGRIHVGSMQASNSGNYNVSYPSQSGFAQAFNGKPDYMKFWGKFHPSNSSAEARISAVIHNNNAVRDPIISSDNQNITAQATLNFTGDNSWHEYTVPFSYTFGNATPEYMLLTFTTNKTPGSGSSGDELFIDDIEFIYLSTLSDLRSNGQTVAGFDANTLTYSVELPYGSAMPTVTATATSANATITITQPTLEEPTATIVVTQGPSTTTYIINYTFAARESADLTDILLEGASINTYNVTPIFNSNTTTYDVVLPFGSDYPTVDGVLELETAQMTVTQPTAQAPTATLAVTCGSLAKTYTVNFTIAPEITADLADLLLDGTTISGFSPQTTDYQVVLPFGAEIPTLSAVAESAAATLTITQATTTDPVGTVLVNCDTLSKTYTVTFTFAEETNSQLSAIYVNGALIANFVPTVYDYTYELPFATDLTTVEVTATTVSPDATITPIIVDTITLIQVTNGDSASTYTVTFTFAAEQTADLADLMLDGETINNFDPAVTTYNEVIFSTEFPVVTATPRSTAATCVITQATEENPTATIAVTCGGLSKNYTVNFTIVEANADLSDLQINGTTIDGFDPAVTEYTYEISEGSSLPIIAATAVSQYATVTIEQATSESPVATITVECGSLTKTYTVNIDIISSIADNTPLSFQIYPNPAEDVLNVILPDCAENTEIVVFNTAGQIVLRQKAEIDTNILKTNNLKSGLYIIQIRNANILLGHQKFVIK